jgi:hypothetical protein
MPTEAAWIPCAEGKPPEGVIVETKIDEPVHGCRNIQTLCRYGRLWFVDERKSMYVYYEPTHWRALHQAEEKGAGG